MVKNNLKFKALLYFLAVNLIFFVFPYAFADYALDNGRKDAEIFDCLPFGPSNSVAVKDNMVFAANGGVILIYDIINIAEPVKISEIRTSGVIMKMSIRGDLLYAAADSDGMYVFDIKNCRSVKCIVHLSFDRSCSDIFLSGELLFLGQEASLKVFKINNSNPADIQLIKEIPIQGQIENMLIAQNMLFAACGKGGLYIFSLKEDFKILKHVYLPDKVTYALSDYQGRIYFNLCNTIYDFDTKSFTYEKVISLPGRREKIYSMLIKGSDAYALSDTGIYCYKIESSFSFRYKGKKTIPADHSRQAVVYSDFMLVASEDAGVMIFDAKITGKLVLKSKIEAGGSTTGAVVDKDSLLVSDYKGINIYNIQDSLKLESSDKVFIKYPGITKARIQQNHIFILHETPGYGERHIDILKMPEFRKVQTIKLPREPETVEIESLRFPGENFNMLIQKNKLFVFTDHHFYAYDVKSIQSPKLECKFYLPGFLRHMNIYQNTLFITEYSLLGAGQDMLVFNLDNEGAVINKRPFFHVKDNPLGRHVQETIGAGQFDKLLEYGRYLYITKDRKLFIFLINNDKLEFLSSVSLPDAVRDISVKEKNNAIYIYLALEKTGLYVVKQNIS